MKDRVVVFTVFEREEYLKKTLDQWAQARDLSKYDFYFRVEPSGNVEAIVDIIQEFKDKVNTDVYTIHNHKVLGCGLNTWTAFNDLFQKYNFVILAEDDIVVSDDILEYFSFLERKYRDDNQIATISANYELDGYSRDLVSRIDSFRGQVWGTWKDRWDKYIKDTWDFAYSTGVDGGPSGWDWNLTLRVLPSNNLKTIAPHSSRSQHIGVNGLHCNEDIFEGTQMKSFRANRPWKELTEV